VQAPELCGNDGSDPECLVRRNAARWRRARRVSADGGVAGGSAFQFGAVGQWGVIRRAGSSSRRARPEPMRFRFRVARPSMVDELVFSRDCGSEPGRRLPKAGARGRFQWSLPRAGCEAGVSAICADKVSVEPVRRRQEAWRAQRGRTGRRGAQSAGGTDLSLFDARWSAVDDYAQAGAEHRSGRACVRDIAEKEHRRAVDTQRQI